MTELLRRIARRIVSWLDDGNDYSFRGRGDLPVAPAITPPGYVPDGRGGLIPANWVPDGRGGFIPPTTEPVPPAGDGCVHHYGDTHETGTGRLTRRNTIHGSGTIDIQTNSNGEILAVWFRCLTLPFRVSVLDKDRNRTFPPEIEIEITAVEWKDAT
jgi:hypothetical protein